MIYWTITSYYFPPEIFSQSSTCNISSLSPRRTPTEGPWAEIQFHTKFWPTTKPLSSWSLKSCLMVSCTPIILHFCSAIIFLSCLTRLDYPCPLDSKINISYYVFNLWSSLSFLDSPILFCLPVTTPLVLDSDWTPLSLLSIHPRSRFSLSKVFCFSIICSCLTT